MQHRTHRRKILNDCLQKQVAAITCGSDFFSGTLLQPATKAGLVFVVVELQESMVLVGWWRRRWRRQRRHS